MSSLFALYCLLFFFFCSYFFFFFCFFVLFFFFFFMFFFFFFFFFQAEDGIRDHCVTGVQTCALPISHCAGSGYSRGSPGLGGMCVGGAVHAEGWIYCGCALWPWRSKLPHIEGVERSGILHYQRWKLRIADRRPGC